MWARLIAPIYMIYEHYASEKTLDALPYESNPPLKHPAYAPGQEEKHRSSSTQVQFSHDVSR